MKKVFFTCNRLGYGGAERVICSFCNEFARNGVQSSIVCLDVLDGFHYVINEEVSIVQLDKNIGKRDSWLKRKVWGLIALYRLFALLRREKPDVVCSFYSKQNCYSILCTRLLNIPIVCAERDSFFLSDGKLNYLLRLMFYRHADGFIHQTEWSKNYLEKTYKTSKDSIVLHNPLWIRTFPDRKPQRGNVIAVGRLAEQQKNYTGLIRAFVRASKQTTDDIRLTIFGEGPSKEDLQEFICEIGATNVVELKGQVDNILDEYGKAEMFILFSFGEGYPNVLMEAMACGVPCIASDCPIGGPASMISNNENGILVENKNEDELCQAILRLHDDEKLQSLFSEKAKEIKEKNSMSIIYEEFYTYLQHISSKGV